MSEKSEFNSPDYHQYKEDKNVPYSTIHNIHNKRVFSTDQAGRTAHNSVFGEQYVGFKSPDILVQFQYNVSEFDVVKITANTGSITRSVNTGAIASTGVGQGSATITSSDSVRYRPGHESFVIFTSAMPDSDASVTQSIGFFDNNNGYVLEKRGSSVGILIRNQGIDDFTSQEFFNVDKLDGTTGPAIDFTKLNIFRMTYGWLGVAPTVFEWYSGPQLSWICFHRYNIVNLQINPSIGNPTLPICAEVKSNADSLSNVSIFTGSWCGGSNSDSRQALPSDRLFATSNSKVMTSTEETVITLHSLPTIGEIENFVHSEIAYLCLASDGNKNVVVNVIKNPIYSAALDFANVDSNNSSMAISSNTETITDGTIVFAFALGKEQSEYFDLTPLSLRLRKNDNVSITAKTDGSSNVTVTVGWRELF